MLFDQYCSHFFLFLEFDFYDSAYLTNFFYRFMGNLISTLTLEQ